MKKQNLINLVKYHVDGNNDAFASEVAEIAREFDNSGDFEVAEYLMDLISDANYYVPQSNYQNLKFLIKVDYSSKPLHLPNCIEEDVLGVAKAINKKLGLSKFLFYGAPGSGKTESAYQIARLLNRDILYVDFVGLIDSRLGESAKNIARLFDEINHLPFNKTLVVFDEIDSLVMDRVNTNDLREMGRITSSFLKELDRTNENAVIIATTNLIKSFDKALIRRFDATISFDRYTREDLTDIADIILKANLKKSSNTKLDMRLFHKILSQVDPIPYPGDLKQLIKTAVAFSDDNSEYDYLRKLYLELNDNSDCLDVVELSRKGFTLREIEILTKIPKSSVARKIRGDK